MHFDCHMCDITEFRVYNGAYHKVKWDYAIYIVLAAY